MKKVRTAVFGFFVLLCSVMNGYAGADTQYNFSFTTDNGITSSGWFILGDDWVASQSWQSVSTYSGNLNVGLQPGISSGSLTSLSVYNIPVTNPSNPYGIRFSVGGITYTALDNKGDTAEFQYSLSYKPSGGTSTDSEILTHTFTSAALVPEIDGGKLAQAALLVVLLFLLFRVRNRVASALHNVA